MKNDNVGFVINQIKLEVTINKNSENFPVFLFLSSQYFSGGKMGKSGYQCDKSLSVYFLLILVIVLNMFILSIVDNFVEIAK